MADSDGIDTGSTVHLIADALAPRYSMLDLAARYVISVGYDLRECLLQTMQVDPWSVDHGSVETTRLIVLGEPFFEVVTARSPMVDFKFTITHTPKLLRPLMPKRTDDTKQQIIDARSMPANWKSGTGAGTGKNASPDSAQLSAAESPTPAHPGAPAKLPGYGGGK